MNSWSNYLHDHTIRWHMWRRQKVGLRFWPATIEHIFIQHNVVAGDRQLTLSTCCCCCSVVTRFFTKSFWEDFHPMLEPELEPTTTECRTNCWVDYRCDYWVTGGYLLCPWRGAEACAARCCRIDVCSKKASPQKTQRSSEFTLLLRE